MAEKLKIEIPIIVEGKYDKNTLLQIVDAPVITTGGFALFNSREKQAFIKRLADERGVIVLTDSDAGGDQIRRHLSSVLPKDKIYNVYIPRIEGKEKRKKAPSKSGTLGVEGMDRATIERILSPFRASDGVLNKTAVSERKMITKLDFFEAGLSGGASASEKRRALARYFSLPETLTAGALLEALNLLVGKEEYERALRELGSEE